MSHHIPDCAAKRRRLRIAMVVPPWYDFPPLGYGGLEQMCAGLADCLVRQGHKVVVIGAGVRSSTLAHFISTVDDTQHLRLGEGLPEMLHVARANQLLAQSSFDVIHDHTAAGLLTAPTRDAPTVATVHNCPTGELGDLLASLPQVSLVAISAAQRQLQPDLAWAATIHNGMAFPPSPLPPPARTGAQGPVLWLARFSPDKGPDLAIHSCRAAGLPLVLAGKCTEPDEKIYLNEVIRPMLGPDTHLVLNPDRRRSNALLAAARCLIMPIRWQEPFGMVMVEAMAVGKPVVALDRGAVREVVRPGVTGFVCATPAELPEALHHTDMIDPTACQAHVRQHFSAARMARHYAHVYQHSIRTASRAGEGRPRRAVYRTTTRQLVPR